MKTHTAEQAGARALILYSDPGDDGEAKGPAWPDGYWRGEQMLQRGNAKYSWFWHGDPLTPGVGATTDARADRRGDGADAAEDPGRGARLGRGAALWPRSAAPRRRRGSAAG